MSNPWLTLVGLGEDGGKSLPDASRDALDRAEIVIGGARHLALVAGMTQAEAIAWPIPFSIAPVLAHRGRRVVVLASGDPFWFGAGSSLMPHLAPEDWVSHPAPSSFALAANRLGWPLESTICHGLHAAPFARLRADLQQGARLLVTLRDGAAASELAAYLAAQGHGASRLTLAERLGGPAARLRRTRADAFDLADIAAPVLAAIEVEGEGLPRAFGLPDALFASDGQITKAPMRALTLAALAPRRNEVLWDIGAGSGSISVEWCLAGGRAHAIEARAARIANITANAAAFGIEHRLHITHAAAPEGLAGLPPPNAVFIGGGGSAALFGALWPRLPKGCRLVANAVTLETEALLTQLQAAHGGTLMRIDIARAEALGASQSWKGARPVVQWSARV